MKIALIIFNDIINIKNTKNRHLLYRINYYITIKSGGVYKSIHTVNPLSFIIGEVDGYIKESNGNKYLSFVSADKNKEVLKK